MEGLTHLHFSGLIIGICTFLNALDGFDVLAMAFTANQVSEEFSLNGAQLGVLLSSGLFGMAAGLGVVELDGVVGAREERKLARVVEVDGGV